MCGIVGCLYFDRSHSVSESLLTEMRDSLTSRGPDDAGLFIDRNVGLGFRRLSIIDLSSAGHQPMLNDSNSVGLVFNGEIYNFKELRIELEKLGFKFRSKTDSEVLLKAYEAWGAGCLERLDGMFAFAIWDQTKRQIFLARDRFGIKPLVWAHNKEGFYFASEISALLKIPHLDREINFEAVWAYLGYLQIPAPLTIYRSIHKLEPAHAMIISESGIQKHWNYWSPPQVDHRLSTRPLAELQKELNRLLDRSIQKHLVADVPVGIALSGGLDSSALVAIAARNSQKPIKTFSVAFDGFEGSNEVRYQRLVSKAFQTEHFEIPAHPNLLHHAKAIMLEAGEPYAISSATALLEICQFAKNHVKVIISGDGGDEIFGGYVSRYKNLELIRRLHELSGPLAKPIAQSIQKIFPELSASSSVINKLKTLSHFLPLHHSDRLQEGHSVFTSAQKRRAVLKEFAPNFSLNLAPTRTSKATQFHSSPLEQILNYDVGTTLSDEMLTKTDYASSATSLEGRVPLLDKDLAEFALRIPTDLKIKNNEGKYIFRKSVQSLLPKEVYARPKQGFELPMGQYMKERDFSWFSETQKMPWLNRTALATMLKQHQHGQRDWSMHLWAIECLRIWHDEVR